MNAPPAAYTPQQESKKSDQGIHEVESILEMRTTAKDKKEFLIKWRSWGHRWNTWEPEEHILDRRMLRKFNKKRPAAEAAPAVVGGTDSITLRSKRRCAKQATVKARMVARQDGQHEYEEDEFVEDGEEEHS